MLLAQDNLDVHTLDATVPYSPFCYSLDTSGSVWHPFLCTYDNLSGTKIITELIILLIVLSVFVFGLRTLIRKLTRPEMTGMSRQQITKRWVEIRKTSEQSIMGAKLALLEADTLLDAGLKSMMMPGETLGERLKVACYKYPKLRDVWWAHKLRNNMAHDATFQLTAGQARQAINEFEKALKVLNVID